VPTRTEPERVLTERELNRALLARQLLLERPSGTIPRTLERLCGIQTQYAPAGYIGLWTRLDGFRRDDLTRALERKTVVQAWMMRSTIHMASKADFWRFCAAVRGARRATWQRGFKRAAREASAAATKVRRLLADGPRKRSEIVAALGLDTATWYGACLWVDLVRVPPSGTWEMPRADRYAVASDWLGDPPEVTEEEGVDHLVRRYLAAFGPASRADVASFTGLPPASIAAALDRIRIRRFQDEHGGELVDVPRAPLPGADTPAPVRFLPVWDATLLTQARRTQILPERYRGRVFNTKTPHSFHTFLVDGQVAGTWRFEGDRIHVEPYDRLSPTVARTVRDEADRLRELFVTP
jgi:uncharacterized protein YcaQ